MEKVRVEWFQNNDRCEGASQSQIFEAGTCTKYNLVPDTLSQPIYIIASTQSSLRFQKWLFETSHEYWRLEQMLKRRKTVRQNRLAERTGEIPTGVSNIDEDNGKSLLRGNANNRTAVKEVQNNQDNSEKTVLRRSSHIVVAKERGNQTNMTSNNVAIDEKAGQELHVENSNKSSGSTKQVSVPSQIIKPPSSTEQVSATSNQVRNTTTKKKCKICRAGVGKLLKILKLHFKDTPNRRIAWQDFLDKMEVKERPLKPLKVYFDNMGADGKVDVESFQRTLETEVDRVRRKLGMPLLRKQ